MTKSVYLAINRAGRETQFTAEALERLGSQIDLVLPEEPLAALPEDLGESFDAVITSWSTPSSDPGRFHGDRLRLVVHTAGSIRHLLPRTLLERGVAISQAGSEPMAQSVAECAVALTLMGLRHLHTFDRLMQSTRDWQVARPAAVGRGLPHLRVGVHGLSRSGANYARMIAGLDPQSVSAHDPYWSDEDAAAVGVGRLVELDELYAGSDVLAIHAPVTEETRGIVDARRLAMLPDGALVVNTARSAVVDMEALIAEVRSGRLSAALDVYDEEPLPADFELFGLPNAILLPHVAGHTVGTRFAQGDVAVDEVLRWARGEDLVHGVSPEAYDRLS